jgi:hypothetical protein
MCEDLCLLVTVFYEAGNSLMRCALKVKPADLPAECDEYWAEPDNRQALWEKLPLHVRNSGKIVEVENIFEIYDATK